MKKKVDFILMILNCERYKYKAEYQKNSWLKDINLFYFHVIGNPQLEKEFEFKEEEKILYVKCEDDYNHLPLKVICALNAIYELFDFQFVFKTDDDQDLIKPNLFSILQNILKTKDLHYGGKVMDVKQPYYSQYHRIHSELPENIPIYPTKYCTGRFYFLSKIAVKYLINQKHFIIKEYIEDYAIGFNLHSSFKTEIFEINTDTFFQDITFPEELHPTI